MVIIKSELVIFYDCSLDFIGGSTGGNVPTLDLFASEPKNLQRLKTV